MSKEIRDPAVVLGLLERGEAMAAFRQEFERVLRVLQHQSGDRNKAKGSITLTLNLTVDSGLTVAIDTQIASKTPKEKRATTTLFVTRDGALTQDHPEQIAMFPREAKGMEIAG